jgi:predicted glycoside hydrolase/deacetylase ChbG (UPF0249 family)
MRNLIITADDCGLSEGINIATARLCEKGVITAASVMANFKASRHALELFAHHSGLDVGVHLNLTDGFSLTRTHNLGGLSDGSGRFRGRRALFSNALAARRGFLTSARMELAAQIDFFLDLGVKPRHLTAHLHFHTLPSLRSIICELAHEYSIEWVRTNKLLRAVVPYNVFLSKAKQKEVPDPSCTIRSPDYVVGLNFWMRYASPKQLLAKLLSIEGTVELVIHPCLEHDPTYPQAMSYPPHHRYHEMQYFERFLLLLQNERPEDFRLTTMHDAAR